MNPFRNSENVGVADADAVAQHNRLLWEGELYGPSDSRYDGVDGKMTNECRVRIVRTFVQIVYTRVTTPKTVQHNEVEVTTSRDKLGNRVWRPAAEFVGSGYANDIIAAVARAAGES